MATRSAFPTPAFENSREDKRASVRLRVKMRIRLPAVVASLSIGFGVLWNLPDSPLSDAAYGQETAIHASYNGIAGFNLREEF